MSPLPGTAVGSMLAEILAGSARYLAKRPKLPSLFDKVAEELGRVAAGSSATKVVARVTGIALVSLDALAAPGPSQRQVVTAGWSGHPIAVLVDEALVELLVALSLGDGEPMARTPASHPSTHIDTAIVRCVLGELVEAVERAFSGVLDAPLQIDDIARELDRKRFGGGAASVLEASFEVGAGEAGGLVSIVLPRALLDTMPLDRTDAREAGTGADTRWAEQLQAGITRANVELQFVLGDWACSLGDLMRMRVGQVLTLDVTPQSLVRAESNDEPILLCELGRSQGRFTARVDDFADRERAFVNGLLAG